MPKIIENLSEKLITECAGQIESNGYRAMTVRSVARECGVGVGTVYNYFSSKDDLVAHSLLRDWNGRMEKIRKCADEDPDSRTLCRCIYGEISGFMESHAELFSDSRARKSFEVSSRQYHSLLRDQLAEPLKSVCEDLCCAEFAAEALLTWTVAEWTFEELWSLLGKCLERKAG